MDLGTTFDFEHAEFLGLDYMDALKRIVSFNLSPIRIGIKWGSVEAEKGNYNWGNYDEILEYLEKKGVPVVLVVGMKSPRWPEFYIPNWVFEEVPDIKYKHVFKQEQHVFKDLIISFLDKIHERYGKLKNIIWIQVENEPLFRFGPNKWKISPDLLQAEISHINQYFDHKIVVSSPGLPTTGVSTEFTKLRYFQKKKLLTLKHVDVIGFNVFPKFQGTLFRWERTHKASMSSWKYLKRWLKRVQNAKIDHWVTELQAEPWEIGEVNFRDAYANETCTPKLVRTYISRLRSYGVKTILLWGIEFHLACEEAGNDTWIKELYLKE